MQRCVSYRSKSKKAIDAIARMYTDPPRSDVTSRGVIREECYYRVDVAAFRSEAYMNGAVMAMCHAFNAEIIASV